MSRKTPSILAGFLCGQGFVNKLGNIKKILDYGCGRGRDVSYYGQFGYDVAGYDPYEPYGFSALPTGTFDLACLTYVLNVIPSNHERTDVIAKAASYIRPGGFVILVARSEKAIESNAERKGWKRHLDGYWSHEGRGMFEKGFVKEELINLSLGAGLVPHPLDIEMKFNSRTTSLILQK